MSSQLKIALIGYGKMGKMVEKVALSRGHLISAKSSRTSPIENVNFSLVDVAIEFTTPDLAVKHIRHCVDHQTPIIVGTTAWNDHLKDVQEYVTANQGSLLYASNFSIGVNIFFALNRRLAKLMSAYTDYSAQIEETHHLQKLDAPSGTAISMANDILMEHGHITSWVHQEKSPSTPDGAQLAVSSVRQEGVTGKHRIQYNSEIDSIEMIHTAHNRKGFALGAVVAAEWIAQKKGVYTMHDVIKLQS